MSHRVYRVFHYLWSVDLSKSFFNWLCQYILILSIFFKRFCLVEKCGVTPHCLYLSPVFLYLSHYFKSSCYKWFRLGTCSIPTGSVYLVGPKRSETLFGFFITELWKINSNPGLHKKLFFFHWKIPKVYTSLNSGCCHLNSVIWINTKFGMKMLVGCGDIGVLRLFSDLPEVQEIINGQKCLFLVLSSSSRASNQYFLDPPIPQSRHRGSTA